MTAHKRPLGFGDERQVAEFFRISRHDVRERALSGDWRSYVIGGKRVFDLDEIVDALVAQTSDVRSKSRNYEGKETEQ